MARTVPLPGFGAAAVGFDTPFEMLEACHERVQRSLDLLQRLTGYAPQTPVAQGVADYVKWFRSYYL